jgi:hypothetical protein
MKTDAAVKNKDQDSLNRYAFAEDLVKGLLDNFENGQDSIVIGLNGEWGSGKSSLLEFVKNEIINQTKNDPFRNLLFEFNPWRIINQDQLQDQFLKELGIIVGNRSISYEALKKDTKKFINVAETANKANPELVSKIGISTIASLIKNFSKDSSISELKKEVDERLEDDNIKLFVVIDDIDRLRPKEITEIFQLIKLNANFKNTYFLIAFDKDIVIDSLSNEYKINGEKYIEKIIQIDYTIPSIPNEDISRIFAEEIDKIIEKLNLNIKLEQIGSFWDKYLKYYFTNIRHIYRFCNALELRLPSIYPDINFQDFLLIETIRIFEYKIYDWIYKNHEKLTFARVNEMSVFFNGVGGNDKDINEDINKLFAAAKEVQDARSKTKDLLIDLFSLDSGNQYNYIKEDIVNNKKIVSPEYFEQYFSFKISSKNIPEAAYTNFIKGNYAVKKEILNQYRDKNILHKFLNGLAYKVQEASEKEKFTTNFSELLQYSDEELKNYTTEYFNQRGWFAILSFLVTLSNEFKENNGYDLLFDELLKKENSYSSFFVLDFLYNEVFLKNNFRIVSLIPKDYLESKRDKIKKQYNILVQNISNTISENTYNLDDYTIRHILIRLSENKPDIYSQIIESLLAIDDKAILLFRISLSTLTQSNYKGIGYAILDESFILPNLSVKIFNERLSQIELSSYKGDRSEFLELFYNLKEHSFKDNMFIKLDGDIMTKE